VSNPDALGKSVETNLGGNSKYDSKTSEVSKPTYNVYGNDSHDVGSAVDALQQGPIQYSLASDPTTGLGNHSPTQDVTLVGKDKTAPVGLHNVAAGVVSATSKDAINGSQLFGSAQSVADALGGGSAVDSSGQISKPSYSVGGASYNNVGSAITALDNRFDGIDTSISKLQGQISDNYKKANSGIAAAMAASALRYDDRGGKVSAATGMSVYHGQVGIAAGVGWTSEDAKWRANLAGTYSPSQHKPDFGVVGGLSYTFN
jgi:autotransporter adhesin